MSWFFALHPAIQLVVIVLISLGCSVALYHLMESPEPEPKQERDLKLVVGARPRPFQPTPGRQGHWGKQ